jgi:endonuclease III
VNKKGTVMEIKLPDINELISEIVKIESSYNGEIHRIESWIQKHRRQIEENRELVKSRSDKADIEILISILRDLLVRAIKGESGEKVYTELRNSIKSKQDLKEKNYRQILRNAKYRWGEEVGNQVITDVVTIFAQKFKWDWKGYFDRAEKYHETDFQEDELLKIKNIKLKVRDLALSSFNSNYVANDLHVTRVITRIGLLNYGYDLLKNNKLEMGNNPNNKENYLFLHRLIQKLSKLTDYKYFPADLDRIFWHFGKSTCGAKPMCSKCTIKNLCLTGQYKK